MTILVTGHLGFVGSSLFAAMALLNEYPVGIDEEYFFKENWNEELIKILEEISPSVVFHVGACSDTLETDVNYMMKRNYESTKTIADYCDKNNIPLIYSSSAANYGSDGAYPSNLYGWSKYAAEDYVISKNGVALRYFNVYGPGEHKKGRMSSLAYQAFMKHTKGESVALFPQRPRRDFVYIEDIISANIYAWNNYKKVKGSYYEVGSGTPRTFEDMLDNLKIPFTYTEHTQIPKGYQFYTCSKEEKWLPGWAPQFTLETGLSSYRTFLKTMKETRQLC
jgi:ADP-L-glycero-D-manno-heptose 6-epimerase